jgi:hypothetical protein
MEGRRGGAIMVGWAGDTKTCRVITFFWGPLLHAKNHPPKIQNASKFEKDLTENVISRKRENHTETLGGGMW